MLCPPSFRAPCLAVSGWETSNVVHSLSIRKQGKKDGREKRENDGEERERIRHLKKVAGVRASGAWQSVIPAFAPLSSWLK